MANSRNAQFIKLPNMLAAKVTVVDEDPDTKYARAQHLLEQMEDEFIGWAEKYLSELKRAVEAAGAEPDDAKIHLERIYRLSHDIKGQGTTFGYPLATEIGESLCQFVEKIEVAGETEIAVIVSHVDALSAIIHNRITADGGEIGREVTSGLKVAVDKLVSRARTRSLS